MTVVHTCRLLAGREIVLIDLFQDFITVTGRDTAVLNSRVRNILHKLEAGAVTYRKSVEERSSKTPCSVLKIRTMHSLNITIL